MRRVVSIILIMICVFFVGCTNFNKKKLEDPIGVYNSILIDDSTTLNQFLRDGFPVNYKNKNSVSLLEYAVLKDSKKSVALLLSKGGDPDQNKIIYKVKSFDILELLVKNSTNINVKNSEGTPLIIDFIKNKPTKYTEYLIDSGVDLTVEDSDGWRPIFWASVTGENIILKKIIKSGSSPLSLDKKGNYPIYYATQHEKLMALLEYSYTLNVKNLDGEDILGEVYLRSVAMGYKDVLEKLLQKGVNVNYSSYGRGAREILDLTENVQIKEFLEKKGLK